ncbi:MAG: hypothetical protein ACR2PR_03305 [Pseudohongiellaceae bacterium]
MDRNRLVVEHQTDFWIPDLAPGDVVEYIPPQQSPDMPGKEIGEVRSVRSYVVFVFFPRTGKVEPTSFETLRLCSYWEALGVRFSGEL